MRTHGLLAKSRQKVVDYYLKKAIDQARLKARSTLRELTAKGITGIQQAYAVYDWQRDALKYSTGFATPEDLADYKKIVESTGVHYNPGVETAHSSHKCMDTPVHEVIDEAGTFCWCTCHESVFGMSRCEGCEVYHE